jgi:polyhydroxyalkanoate synthesis regulator phasin
MFAAVVAVFAGYGSSAASSESRSPDSARQQLARDYVAALQSKDPARIKALIHPTVLACKNFADYFDLTNEHIFKNVPGSDYKISFTVLPDDFKLPILPPDKFEFPVRPSYELRIDWEHSEGSSVRLASIIQFIAEKDGAWLLVYPCPNDAGIKLVHQIIAAGQLQQEHAHTLASQLKDPLRAELKAMLADGRKVDAIRRYETAAGADPTTAKQVIDALESQVNKISSPR